MTASSQQQILATDGQNSKVPAVPAGSIIKDEMESAPSNAQPPVSSQRQPPAAGRRMRSASNIAVVEAPSVAGSNNTSRPVQRAIRETFREEEEMTEREEKADLKPVAEAKSDNSPKPETTEKEVETVTEPAEKPEQDITSEQLDPIASTGSAVEPSSSAARDITDIKDYSDAISENAAAAAAAAMESEQGKSSSESQEQKADNAAESKLETKDDDNMQINEKTGSGDKVVAEIMDVDVDIDGNADVDVATSNDRASSSLTEGKIEEDKGLANEEKEEQRAALESSVEIVEEPAAERPESKRSVQLETASDAAPSSQKQRADRENTNAISDTSVAANVAADADIDAEFVDPKQTSNLQSDKAREPENGGNAEDTQKSNADEEEKDNSETNDFEQSSEKESEQGSEQASEEKSAAEEEEVEIEKPRVQVYGSTVSGNRTYKKQARELFSMLEANEIDFQFICIAVDEEAKKYMRRKALGNMTIPQIYVDGEFKGFFEDAFQANEIDELYEWLGLDEEPIEY
ncbi:hypothetical protein LPJ64_001205 [Coemansia asiatica]|uniref:Glutaredoxin domain-containing protein n=1 Tax=Coemansia asiatica TaxID=1052880 RepID=A0A9W8CKU7_9FUNG|nr:hypothetical protein LPJ64_001205 [Coemansia asiatica]